MIMYILRGVPGSGKSTLAKTLASEENIFEADSYFNGPNGYDFDANRLGFAHEDCYNRTLNALNQRVDKIVVSNTCTTERELEKYLDLAKMFGYTTFVMVVENRHGGNNIHGVPTDKVELMKKRLLNSISL